ncbi:MAG: tryptophan synthase subunit alpha [Gammaproteobacteria bacterium]|nr:tryptophan synthase subunit alpha [Gammaproteobacteria bacterium]
MSRIETRFSALKAEGRKALIPFVTAGDPTPTTTVPLMHELVKAGASVLELGVPFSDPMADGTVIQLACERALEHGTSLNDVLAMVAEFRQQDQQTPVVLMGYLNPVEVMGYETFANAAAKAGVDGVLTVDLPPEEGAELSAAFKAVGIDLIYLIAPTTSLARAQRICAQASGFVYYVSLKGVTGSASLDVAAVEQRLNAIRTVSDLPLGVGFGISDAPMAAKMATIADGVVVGSALVKRIADNRDDPQALLSQAADLIAGMRKAMDDV